MQLNDMWYEKLVEHLQQAYAVEDQLVHILATHAQAATMVPRVQQAIERHLAETKQHRLRIETCLHAHGKQPNGSKSTLVPLLDRTKDPFTELPSEVLWQNSQDAYLAENLEIALYTSLIAIARVCDDHATTQACTLNLQDEIRMAKWFQTHLGEIALLALNLQHELHLPQHVIDRIQLQERTELHQLWERAAQDDAQDFTPLLLTGRIDEMQIVLNPGYNQSAIPPDAISRSPADVAKSAEATP